MLQALRLDLGASLKPSDMRGAPKLVRLRRRSAACLSQAAKDPQIICVQPETM